MKWQIFAYALLAFVTTSPQSIAEEIENSGSGVSDKILEQVSKLKAYKPGMFTWKDFLDDGWAVTMPSGTSLGIIAIDGELDSTLTLGIGVGDVENKPTDTEKTVFEFMFTQLDLGEPVKFSHEIVERGTGEKANNRICDLEFEAKALTKNTCYREAD